MINQGLSPSTGAEQQETGATGRLQDLNRTERVERGWIIGIALVVIGGLLFLSQFFDTNIAGLLIFPAFALVFLTWGITSRQVGPMIPAGIFIGLSLGTWLTMSNWSSANLSSDAQGGLFLVAFAAGWVCIPILTTIFAKETHWWPLIPGGIMGIVGLALLIGGDALTALTSLGYIWPLILIAFGIFLLVRRGTGGIEHR